MNRRTKAKAILRTKHAKINLKRDSPSFYVDVVYRTKNLRYGPGKHNAPLRENSLLLSDL